LRLARKLTPAGRDRDRIRRTLDLAQYLFEAGDTTGARSELEALVAEMAPGPDRARVLCAWPSCGTGRKASLPARPAPGRR
jgi:hypothetical protein